MLKKFLATMSVMSLVAVAAAGTITTSLAIVPTQEYEDMAIDEAAWIAAGYVVVDLQVTVGGGTGDSFTAAGATATLTGGGTFWDHPNGGDLTPNPANFSFLGMTRYDGFYTCPEDWPNMGTTGNTSIVAGPTHTPTTRWAEWYVNPADPNVEVDGTYTIARYAFLPTGAWELCVEGNTYLGQSGGTPYPYSVCIPEPSALGLLGLGALALIRRR